MSGQAQFCCVRRRAADGFVLPSAVFLIVILAALAAFMVHVSTTQSLTSAQDIQGTRAYHAARSGLEWGLYQVLDPGYTTVVTPPMQPWPNMPVCPAASTISIEGFAVSVTCQSSDYSEAGLDRRIRVYLLVSTASSGAVGSSTYVERELRVTVSKCRALDAAAPGYECP